VKLRLKIRGLVNDTINSLEKRIILSYLLGGVTEVLIGLTPAGVWLGEHLQQFGYLGTSIILLAGYHEILRRHHQRTLS